MRARFGLHLLEFLLLEGLAFCFLCLYGISHFFAHHLLGRRFVSCGSQQSAASVGAEEVEVAFDVLSFEVEEAFRVDELSEEACLEVEVGACGASGIASEPDDVASLDDLVGLAEVAAHVSVDGLETIGVTDDDEVSVAVTFVFDDAHFAREGRTDGVSDEDFDVCAVVLAAEGGSVAVVAGDESAVARHVELSQVYLVFCGDVVLFHACVFIFPCGVERCSRGLYVGQCFVLAKAYQRDAVDGTHLAVDGRYVGEPVLCQGAKADCEE